MYKNACVAFLVLLCTSLLSPPSQADSVRYVTFNWTQSFSPPACKPLPYGQTMVQIYLDLTAPARSFRFSGPSGYSLSAISWEYPVDGDPAATQTLDFEGCVNGSILLATAAYDVEGYQCIPLIAGDRIGSGSVTLPIVVGCDDVERFADTPCDAAQPTLLSPVDGALNVPLTPTLAWQGGVGDFCIEGIGVYNFVLYVGTSPETLAYVETLPESNQWQLPNPLLPETTYYWRVEMTDDYWNYVGANHRSSVTHRFTTGAPVAAEETSWSTFKRVYRE